MKHFFIVGAGGFLGAGFRYLVYRVVSNSVFPYATLSVNILGCVMIGVFAAYFSSLRLESELMRNFIIVGVLGGFTTYSSFGLDSFMLIKQADFNACFLNIFLHFSLGLLGVFLGFKFFEWLS